MKKYFLLIMCLTILGSTILMAAGTPGVITGDGVRLRKSSSLSAQVVASLFKGNRVTILGRVNGQAYKRNRLWYKIKADAHQIDVAYVHSAFVKTGRQANAYLRRFRPSVFRWYLKKTFTSSQRKLINRYYYAQKKLKGVKDFVKLFALARKVEKNISQGVDKAYQALLKKTNGKATGQLKMAWLYTLTPGLIISYVAEGTVAQLQLYFPFFKKLAQSTYTDIDDEFIRIYMLAYGKVADHWPKWFVQTWDYGGHSLLGQGKHLQVLKKIDALNSKTAYFRGELKKIRARAIQDILTYSVYYESVPNMVREIKQILRNVRLSSSEKRKLNNRIKEFQRGKKGLQTNCKKKNCAYG